MPKVEGGYLILARKLFEGELMDKPGLYMKLWVWMLNEANWRDQGKLKRGQFVTTIKDMREAMAYKVGYRTKTPTIDQIRSAYEAFTKATMITTTKTTRGMVITILNYDLYQDPKSYEAHSEPHDEAPTNPTVTPQDTEEGEEEKKEEDTTPDGVDVDGEADDGPKIPSCPHQEIIRLFHEELPELPEVREWGSTQQTHLRARWKERPDRQSLDWWQGLFKYIRGCPFLMGQVEVPGRPLFELRLRWLVKKENFIKVIEGDYEQRNAA